MKNKIIGFYSIFIGTSVIAMWTIILLNENPTEGKIQLCFHLFSEFLMAMLCIISGILVLRKITIGKLLNILGIGMVIYSVLNAAGYYGEKNDIRMTTMFIVLIFLSLLVLLLHFDKKFNPSK